MGSEFCLTTKLYTWNPQKIKLKKKNINLKNYRYSDLSLDLMNNNLNISKISRDLCAH